MTKNTYILFTNAPTKKYLNFLKDNFRHCIYVEGSEGDWIIIDPLSHKTDILRTTENPINTLKNKGFIMVKVTKKPEPKKSYFPEPITCVTQIKKLLGIQNIFIQTPYQLFLNLKKDNQ